MRILGRPVIFLTRNESDIGLAICAVLAVLVFSCR